MAHTYDTKLEFTGSTNPLSSNYTCGSGATLLVVCIVTAGSTARSGGAPTYNGVAMTEVYQGIKYATTPEASCDMYYMLAPPTGSAYSISVPNSGLNSLWISASSYKADSGKTSAYNDKHSATGATANASDSANANAAGDVVVQVLACGNNSVPTARSDNLIDDNDFGTKTGSAQYRITSGSGSQTLSWTFTADDWGIITADFKEIISFNYVGSGAISISGTAVPECGFSIIGSGIMSLLGSAPCVAGFTYNGSGAIATSGTVSNQYQVAFEYVASGVIMSFWFRWSRRTL